MTTSAMTTSATLTPTRALCDRVRAANEAPVRSDQAYVLHWMVAARRPHHNLALERAAEWSRALQRPLVVFEALRCDYPWASDRLHRFVLDGMVANQRHFATRAVTYVPYLEPAPGAGRGLLAALAAHAAVVVSDEYPCFFIPAMQAAVAQRLPVRFELVDTNGVVPLARPARLHLTARSFRAFAQTSFADFGPTEPAFDPLTSAPLPPPAALPPAIGARWPETKIVDLSAATSLLSSLPIDHGVAPGPLCGGFAAAESRLAAWVESGLHRYEQAGRDLSTAGTSGLSPYLHFGHLSAHAVVAAVLKASEGPAAPESSDARYGRTGDAGAFLDQLITWRELGFHFCHRRPTDYASYDGLPEWARTVLHAHRDDPRPRLYDESVLEAGRTHDALWNAAQRQLRAEGGMPNYLRMLWGKKVIEWSPSPQRAFETLVRINDRYALDGRDPNSYSGIGWVFGRFDRPWGPSRPIFGTVRYMSSESARRKLRGVVAYERRFAGTD